MTELAEAVTLPRICFKCGEPKQLVEFHKVCPDCHVPSDRCRGCIKGGRLR